MATTNLKVRRSIQDIYNDFKTGKDTTTLEKLMVAWQFIKALPPTDPNSFMTLGGFHGEPFAGRGAYDASNYWGGYCNHGNILFPTWHRVYLYKLEKALQSVPGCDSVMLPYWDQTYKIMKEGKLTYLGVPPILTDEYFTFSTGATIPNPLRSFTLPMALQDSEEADFYAKPVGYETVRYPLSGLVGQSPDRAASQVNNAAYYIPGTTTIDSKLTASLLSGNVVGWLSGTVALPNGSSSAPLGTTNGIDYNYHLSLKAPCYTVFSNITSVTQWNKDNTKALTQALELPHGEIHLAVGGINTPFQDQDTSPSSQFIVADANGDMGENETAGLDPIFFFHHCNVDRLLWIWQVNHKSKDTLDITVPGWNYKKQGPYPGTNNIGNQPPVGYEPNEQLTMDSSLYPFKLVEKGTERYFRSSDVFNIETQLGLTYDNLSIDNHDGQPETAKAVKALVNAKAPAPKSDKVLMISGINRATINGSFVIMAYATVNGIKYLVGTQAVLSRWKVTACRNCMTHLEVSATFSLAPFTEEEVNAAVFEIKLVGRKHNDEVFEQFTAANHSNVVKFLTAQRAATSRVAKISNFFSGATNLFTGTRKAPFNLEVR
jgi:tyrosinase